ncbi:MAG: glycosyltransferase [Candidatus Magnetoglobus multicellularis str. Araruama]|uniref:Glycosyltransferase n=1 Tax=Candidatus Magnetoglobus multicellularis str. Araruama TaxID=890399 RepID=A0A1V1PGZ6_9BACT|nr:MAG: glycosyltransferase [Candidatus Magnetoglobus multicellularis str. Araruama]
MKVSFYCNVHQSAFSILEFYKQDINILKDLTSQLKIVNRYRDIDWSSDIIFIWWWTYAFYPIFMAKLLKKKTIITGTFNYRAPDSPLDYYRRPFWQRYLIKYAMKNSSCNILVSRHEFDQIQKDWKLTNLTYSPHVVDTEKYKPVSKSRHNYLFSIISSGKHSIKRKCLPEIILAAKILSIKYPELKFLIAGRDVDNLKSVKDMINELDLSCSIVLLGEISEEKKLSFYRIV